MAISKITGKNYTRVHGITTWDDNVRFKQALKLSQMFGFQLCQPDTEQNLINSVEKLRHMYEDEKLTNSQFVEMFNWQNKFFTSFLETLGIKRRTKSEALKNWCRIQGKEITDPKIKYWNDCQFKFAIQNEPNVIGIELLKNNKWYDPINNIDGLVRDHMYSINDGWKNNIDPKIISHPANCELMQSRKNIVKNNGSSISLEDLKSRIENWHSIDIQQHLSLDGKRTREPLTDIHKQKISDSAKGKKLYTNGLHRILRKHTDVIPDGYKIIQTENTPTTRKTRIFHRPSKWDDIDWHAIQLDIDNAISVKDIRKKYNITNDGLHWAVRGKLITKWYKIVPYEEKFPWKDIQSDLDCNMSLKTICKKYQMTKHQLLHAKSKNILKWKR
jgi:hypothetical protein